MKLTTGRCLCRNIRFEYDGEPEAAGHCHCESCRRQTSAAVTTYVMVRADRLRFTHGRPKEFESSPGAWRGFCADCGSPISFRSERKPEAIDLHAVTLDDPGSVMPAYHEHTSEQLPWFEEADGLPRYAGSRPGSEPLAFRSK